MPSFILHFLNIEDIIKEEYLIKRGVAMLFNLAASPAVMLIIFVFIKDKYEKEPYLMMAPAILFGFLSCGAVIAEDIALRRILGNVDNILLSAFVLSSGTEEITKLAVLYFLMLKNPNLNEPFDAVLYSAYVSLGFAWAENIIYVFSPELGGVSTALMRAVFSVPGHFLFSIFMAGFFAEYHYFKKGIKYLALSFICPWAVHGLYNIIIMWFGDFWLFVFIPYVVLLWIICLKKMLFLSKKSPFKN